MLHSCFILVSLLFHSSLLTRCLHSCHILAGVEHTFVMGDVTYGACCIDDFSALALQADMLVHYGHSCLVPVSETKVPCLYVFVDIQIDLDHLVASVQLNFKPEDRIILAGTIQFAASIQVSEFNLKVKGVTDKFHYNDPRFVLVWIL